MASPFIIPADISPIIFQQELKLSQATLSGFTRSMLDQENEVELPIPLTDLRVWDAFQTNLPGTAATDDLALVGGTFGTNSPSVETGDLKAAGSTTRYARFALTLPYYYQDAETIKLRIRAGMVTTVADTAATVDLEAYLSNGEGGIGSDLVATAAQSANSLTFADLDFTITATTVTAGATLDCRIAFLVNDGATGTEVKGRIGKVSRLLDVKG